MNTKGWPRAVEAQAENNNQPQLATAEEIVEFRQVLQKQAEEAKKREEELTCHHNQLFEAFIRRFSVPQGENRVGPSIEQVGPKIREQHPQPQYES